MNDIILHIERISVANHDDLVVKIEPQVNYRLKGEITVSYDFTVYESTDNHSMCAGHGLTPEQAAEGCALMLKDSCKAWGYKYVD